MMLQLKDEESMKQSMLALTQYALPERNSLADSLFASATSDDFSKIVETMIKLCRLYEPKRNVPVKTASARDI